MSDTDQNTDLNNTPVMDDNIQITPTTDSTSSDDSNTVDIPMPEITDQNEIEETDSTAEPADDELRVAEGEQEVTEDTPEKELAADEAELATESDNSTDAEVAETEETPVDETSEPSTAEATDPDLNETEDDNTDGNMLTSDNPEAAKGRWYVVHTFSGHENRVATTLKQRIESEHLENKIFDILVPTQDKIEIKSGKKETVKEKIFPGYILIKMILDDTSWLAVRTTQGVTAFIGAMNKPTPISEREVAGIVKFMNQGAAPTFKDVFMVSDTVKIIDGPFAEFIGKVDSVDKEKGRVRVLVSIFGRETPVELDFLQVQKL